MSLEVVPRRTFDIAVRVPCSSSTADELAIFKFDPNSMSPNPIVMAPSLKCPTERSALCSLTLVSTVPFSLGSVSEQLSSYCGM